MEASAQESYLVTEVMTATPQKLQLMLIDAAIRSAEKARRLWQEQKNDEACEALIHAQEIVGQMLASLNHEPAPELTRKVAAVYLFIFRSLMEANFHRDESKLDGALKVLRVERETWRQVCEKLGSTLPEASETAGPTVQPDATPSQSQQATGSQTPSDQQPHTPQPGTLPADAPHLENTGPQGLSLEA